MSAAEIPLVAASGLRPLGAFVVIGAVVGAVGVRVSALVSTGEDHSARPVVEERLEPPAYEIVDRDGRLLAGTLRRIDLVVSPRSAWQGHTPDHMARVLSEAIGGHRSPEELLAAMIPDARGGEITVDAWSLGPREALAVGDWILRGESVAGRPLRGFELAPDPERRGRFRLRWRPATALSRETREAHGETSPIRWTRRIADGLAAAVLGPRAIGPGGDPPLLRDQRRAIWRALMPSGYCKAIEDLPADRALPLMAALEAEGVRPHQMKLDVRRERVHPSGDLGVLGDWGYLRPEQTRPEPRSGLELSCARLLASPWASWIERAPGGFAFREQMIPRRPVRPYFVGARAGSVPPVFRSTLETDLMRRARELLEACVSEHRAALAMAVVLDVETGGVLAVDAVQEYDFQGWAPAVHQFTPGSTFKIVTMALALDEGVVRPDEIFDVGRGGAWRLEDSRRVIHEAEGHAEGEITAAQCLSESMNAGLVQIGLRVDSRVFRSRMLELGYGRAPGLGLGPERSGSIPDLATSGRWEGLWPRYWAHASVCFGHEVSTTLVQHAAALAAVLRGGEWRPLRFLESVAQAGRAELAPAPAPARRVVGERAAREVRAMMELGAREGTGRKLWRDTFELATKTGTAEKVASEVCAHALGAAVERHLAAGTPLLADEYRALRDRSPEDHASCYTSSVCAVGRLFGGEREVMVLVVVEEPRRGGKFGSDVAGPTAVALLEEALGFTSDGRLRVPDVVPGFAPLRGEWDASAARPWTEELP